jgi:hypothetical protein
LKKQSQFIEGQIGVNSSMKGVYGKILPCGALKNKANQNQYYLAPRFTLGVVEKTNPIWKKYYIGRLTVVLFELYQCNPVFVGLAGRLADID